MDTAQEMIRWAFLDPQSPAAYSSAQNVLQVVRRKFPKATIAHVHDILQRLSTYTLHKGRRKHFKRLKTLPDHFMSHVQIDLADYQKIAKENENFKYILVGVDVLSRRLFATPTKSKSTGHMLAAFKRLFRQMPTIPRFIFSDRGLEFLAGGVKEYLKDFGIIQTMARTSDIKAGIAERFIRTLKSRLHRYFTEHKTTRYIEILPKLVHAINHTKSRATGLRPIDINFENAMKVREKVYAELLNAQREDYRRSDRSRRSPDFYEPGDHVRVAKQKTVFEKSYLPNYTQDIFEVENVVEPTIPTTYELKTTDGQSIKGKFYKQEMTRTKAERDHRLVIAQVLKTRRRRGLLEYYVTWKGRPLAEAQWISEADVDQKKKSKSKS